MSEQFERRQMSASFASAGGGKWVVGSGKTGEETNQHRQECLCHRRRWSVGGVEDEIGEGLFAGVFLLFVPFVVVGLLVGVADCGGEAVVAKEVGLDFFS